MGKVGDECYFLYQGFRPYVQKKKLEAYDNEYYGRKVHTIKFMIGFIDKFINIKYYYKRPKDPKDGYLFNFYITDFSQRNSKITKSMKEFKETRRTIDINFMYRNAHPM